MKAPEPSGCSSPGQNQPSPLQSVAAPTAAAASMISPVLVPRGAIDHSARPGVPCASRRSGNECLPYDRFGRLMAEDDARIPSWLVFDSREGGRLPAIAMPEGSPEEHLAAGTWVTADTIPELATRAGLPADALVATVERFNRFAQTGEDEDFGRGQDEYDTFFAGAGSPNKALVPVDQGPYYAARFVLSDLGTKGGLVTDASARVIDRAGVPIPGLYAASNSTASVFGSAYPGPGAPLGAAMVYASLAVADMLERRS